MDCQLRRSRNSIRVVVGLLVLIAHLLFVTNRAIAQNEAGVAPIARGHAADLIKVLNGDPPDCGRVRVGEAVVRRISLVNVSNAVLTVRVAGTSCPCLNAGLSRNTVPAGETAVLTLMTTSIEAASPQSYTAQVEAIRAGGVVGETERQRLALSIGYTPDIEVIIWPMPLKLMTVAGVPVEAELAVRLTGKEPAPGVAVEGPEWLRTGPARSVPGAPSEVRVALRAEGLPPGVHRAPIFVRAGPGASPLRTDVALRVNYPYTAVPPGIVLDREDGVWRAGASQVVLSRTEGSPPTPSPHHAELRNPRVPMEIEEFRPVESDRSCYRIRVRVKERLASDATEFDNGNAALSIVAENGDLLCEIPVVWIGGWRVQTRVRENGRGGD
jgi:hypothetical protein